MIERADTVGRTDVPGAGSGDRGANQAAGTQKSFRSGAELMGEWEERAGGVPDGGAGG